MRAMLPAKEAIAAGVLMGTPQLCLVHAKVGAGQVTLSVRTRDAAYSQCVSSAIATALAGK